MSWNHGGGHGAGGGHHGHSVHGHQRQQYAGYQQTGPNASAQPQYRQTAPGQSQQGYYQQPGQGQHGYHQPGQQFSTTQSSSAPPYQAQSQAAYGYGGYGQQPGGMQYQPGHAGPVMGQRAPPPGVDPTIWGWFQAVDRRGGGQITSDELQQALLNNNWSHFNAETCRLMIGMFDKDGSGTIDIHEFVALWNYIQQWKACFDSFDTDRSGDIDQGELNKAFTTFGYRLSPQFCNLCVRVFDRTSVNTMKFDDFIQCCVMLKTLTDSFRKFDTNQNGVINISYEQFMDMVLNNTLSGI